MYNENPFLDSSSWYQNVLSFSHLDGVLKDEDFETGFQEKQVQLQDKLRLTSHVRDRPKFPLGNSEGKILPSWYWVFARKKISRRLKRTQVWVSYIGKHFKKHTGEFRDEIVPKFITENWFVCHFIISITLHLLSGFVCTFAYGNQAGADSSENAIYAFHSIKYKALMAKAIHRVRALIITLIRWKMDGKGSWFHFQVDMARREFWGSKGS